MANCLDTYNKSINDIGRLQALFIQVRKIINNIVNEKEYTEFNESLEKPRDRLNLLLEFINTRINILKPKSLFNCNICKFETNIELDYDTHMLWIHCIYRQLCGTMNDVRRKMLIDEFMKVFFNIEQKEQFFILKKMKEWNIKNSPQLWESYKIKENCGRDCKNKCLDNEDKKTIHDRKRKITYKELEIQYDCYNTEYDIFLRKFGTRPPTSKQYDQWLEAYNKEMSDPMYREPLWLSDGSVNPKAGNI